MIVGVVRLRLALPGVDSSRSKGRAIRSILDRVRARLHISAAEVDAQTRLQQAILGFSTVGSDRGRVDSVLDRLVEVVESQGDAQVMGVERELLDYDHIGDDDMPPTLAEKFGAAAEVSPTERTVTIRPGSLGFGSRGEGEEE